MVEMTGNTGNWQDSVRAERAEVAVRLTTLAAFITSNPVFKTLDLLDQGLLQEQRDTMLEYVEVLDERIARFR